MTRRWVEIDARVAQALASERIGLFEAMGEQVGQMFHDERVSIMREVRDELRELRHEAARLGSQIAALREAAFSGAENEEAPRLSGYN
jgi:hypothetical protein